MSFIDLNFKKTYSSDIDDILNDFFIPAVRESKDYKRLTGFFSSSSLAVAARGLGGLIEKNGSMKMVISPRISKKDFESMRKAQINPEEFVQSKILPFLENIQDEFERDHFFALGWMLANKRIEIRVAIPFDKDNEEFDFDEWDDSNIFHQKVAILEDSNNNRISFSGSVNESASGWLGHIEEFKVFRSWESSQIEYLESDIAKFDRFWNDLSPRVMTFKLPDAIKKRLMEISPSDKSKLNIKKWESTKKPSVKLYDYQDIAIKNWVKNDKKGIFDMATGTGKTFTALGCVDFELKQKKPLLSVIASPYSHLVQQWKREIDHYGLIIEKMIIADSKTNWKHDLADSLRNLELNQLSSLVVLTTHATFSSKDFIEIFKNTSKSKFSSLLIIDEVHGIGAEKRKLGLLPDYQFRLGLSATPNRFFDDEGDKVISDYFGPVCFEFSLEDAINTNNPATGDTYLTPYRYHPLFLSLTNQEREEYVRKTKSIAINVSRAHNPEEKREKLQNLLISRAKIIKNASEKTSLLKQLLIQLGPSIKWAIIYCEDKHQMDKVIEITTELKLISHRFTMEEGTVPKKEYRGLSERDYLLENFADGKYQILVAKKCLDEGVDVPAARIAILIASSTNPREYIQRIGRVIRRSPDKREAGIYDMIVAPSLNRLPVEMKRIESNIFQKEITRCQYIAGLAINNVEALKAIHKKIQES